MTHVRRQIRDAAATAIQNLPTTGARVYQSRFHTLSQSEVPGWIVSTDDVEEVERIDATGLQRELRIIFTGVVRTENDTDLENILDTMAEELEGAMLKSALNGLVAGLSLESTEFDYQVDENDQPIAAVILTYAATYFTNIGAPGVTA